ncbi:Pycsar system effector family protein [Paraburkholderia tropica]|uniref:Pycsar system effector family protein n=1 Tax=Paraburkholderia tropica TaxID=92647 RepID=UPI002AB5E854|nr:Pycsar system effector family protein [Paraburkholderia tropica]
MDRLETNPPTKERLATAQWIFERQLAWIAAADVKVGVVVSIDLALLGGLAAAFSGASHKTLAGEIFAALAGITLIIAVVWAAVATFPRLNGPKKSLLFFGRIADRNADQYAEALLQSSDADLISDWARQIHTNAKIAVEKHSCVRCAMIWSFAAVIPWLIALCYFVTP